MLSNNDSCVVARSNEVKALGVKMGTPAFELRPLIQEHPIEVFSSNYALYGDLSRRVMETLGMFTPDIEVYSIDEAFLDLSGHGYQAVSQEIRRTVKKWTGIPVSIGVAATKTLAKVANQIAKQQEGICVLREPEPVLAQLPVSEVWGIGRQLTKRLEAQGIITALQLREADIALIKQLLGIAGVRTVLELRGVPCLPLEMCPQPRKSCCVSRGFGRPMESLAELREAVAFYGATAAAKLRRDGQVAKTMTVFITTSRFRPREPYYANSQTLKLPYPANDTPTLVRAALGATEQLYQPGYSFHKAGVMLMDLSPEEIVQGSIFEGRARQERSWELMEVIDSLNRQFGSGTIRWAAEGLRQDWRMRADRLTQRYTTHWDELVSAE